MRIWYSIYKFREINLNNFFLFFLNWKSLSYPLFNCKFYDGESKQQFKITISSKNREISDFPTRNCVKSTQLYGYFHTIHLLEEVFIRSWICFLITSSDLFDFWKTKLESWKSWSQQKQKIKHNINSIT